MSVNRMFNALLPTVGQTLLLRSFGRAGGGRLTVSLGTLRLSKIRRQKRHKNIEADPHTRRPAFEFVAEIRVKCGFMSRSKRLITQNSKPASNYVLEWASSYCYTCYTCFHSTPSIYSFLFYNSTFMCNSVTKGKNNKVVS